MIETLISETVHFTHIFHVGDIHIRLTKRHDEYREVFSKLYEEVKNSPPATLVCVMGDVVHSKIDLSPECVQLVKDFLFNLSELRPVVLVAGNHDTNLANRNRMDSLTPIVNAINHPQLYYLKKSGLYGIGNVCLNNYSVFDSVEKYMRGDDIPKAVRNQYQYFVVLYHGIVNNAMTELGFRLINKAVGVDLFKYHDIALLGDIHLRQTLQTYDGDNNDPAIHYCGSLIQKDHGELIPEHGYSLWDLKRRMFQSFDIPNDYGYFTVVMDRGQIISDLDNIPKKARIQFQLFETVVTEVKAALTKLREKSNVLETSYSKLESADAKKKQTVSNAVMLGNIANRDYQISLLKNYLKSRLNITDPDFIDKVIAVHDITHGVIKKDDFARNIRWVPIRFEWDNLFSYGEGNVIDFTKQKGIVGLFAPNASGKSTILSALSFCIFDKCDREFKAANILNIQKTSFRCKFEFEIDGIHYFIERKGRADRKGDVKVEVLFWKVENGKDIDLQGKERKDTNVVIREYLGSYEDFVLTALSLQGGKNNNSVIDMGHTDRKDLLAQFMGLSIFDRLHTEANERMKELTTLLKAYSNDDHTKKLVDYNNFLSQAESLYRQGTDELETIDKQRKSIHHSILDESLKLIKIDVDVPPIEESKKNKVDLEKKVVLVKAEIEPTAKKVAELAAEILALEKVVADAEKKDTTKNYFKHQELTKKRDALLNKWNIFKVTVDNERKIIEKTKEHQYDPNCKFCMSNASKFIADREAATKRLEQYKKDGIKLKSELEKVQSEISKLEWTQEAVAVHQTSLAKLNASKTLQFRTAERISVIQKTLLDLETEIKECDKNIDLFNKNVEAIYTNKKINLQIDVLKHDLSKVEYTYSSKNKSLVDLNGKMSVAKNQIETINKKIREAKELENEYKVYEVYIQAVCRDGIPFNVITTTVPEVEREVNSILSQIAEFTAKFETDGKNIIPYIVYDDRKWLMSLTSGFERFALSIAIRVALISISNLPRPNFLAIDEGFGVLDAENLSAMSSLFSYLKSNFDFVLVVSHLDALRDMVDKHIEITKDGGFSKVNS